MRFIPVHVGQNDGQIDPQSSSSPDPREALRGVQQSAILTAARGLDWSLNVSDIGSRDISP